MVVKLQSTASDLTKEREGDTIASLLYPGVTYQVRSVHYEPFATARDLALQNLARKYGDQPVPRDESVKIMGGLFVEHLLLGWEGFRFDRQYGAFGGESRLSYMVIRQYAADHCLSGENLQTFKAVMRGLDEEWLDFIASRTKTGAQGQ